MSSISDDETNVMLLRKIDSGNYIVWAGDIDSIVNIVTK